MKVNVLGDFWWESKLDHVLRVLNLRHYFQDRNYGSDVNGVVIDLICNDPKLNQKQRIRFTKNNKTLYMDIMLKLNDFIEATHQKRRELVAENILKEVPKVLKKYNFKDFEYDKFISDLEEAINIQLLGPESSRYDQFSLERAGQTKG